MKRIIICLAIVCMVAFGSVISADARVCGFEGPATSPPDSGDEAPAPAAPAPAAPAPAVDTGFSGDVPNVYSSGCSKGETWGTVNGIEQQCVALD